jgi:hypothetical protein
MRPYKTLVSIVTITGLGVGCAASTPPPSNEWAAAQADIGRAQAAGAPDQPDAKLHLQLAQEDQATGKRLFDQDNKRATTLMALARTEAQLSFSLAREAQAEAQAKVFNDQLAKAEGK